MRDQDAATSVESDHETPARLNWWLVGVVVALGAFWYYLGIPALAAFARMVR